MKVHEIVKDGFVIAGETVDVWNGNGKEGYLLLSREEANAIVRFVAAAPDLLAACKAALDNSPCRLDHHGNCQEHSLGNPCEQKLLREAIAKAEGEKQ